MLGLRKFEIKNELKQGRFYSAPCFTFTSPRPLLTNFYKVRFIIFLRNILLVKIYINTFHLTKEKIYKFQFQGPLGLWIDYYKVSFWNEKNGN